MTDTHDRPGAGEILEAVSEFLRDEVAAADDARLRYHALVAVNLLSIVARELAAGPEPRRRWHEAMRTLGVADAADLAARLRDGRIDSVDRAARRALRTMVEDKVRVAKPDHLERRLPPHDPVNAAEAPDAAR